MANDINAEIYNLGKLAYMPEDIGIMMGMTADEVTTAMEDPESEFYRSYHKGYYETDILVRQSIFKLAAAGSSPAQSMAGQILKNNLLKKIHE